MGRNVSALIKSEIQLANRSIMHPLDMEDEPSSKGSTLILDKPFLMMAKTKIDVHVGTLSMEFGDNMVQFNIFEAMKHPTENHSIFDIDVEAAEIAASEPSPPSTMQPLALELKPLSKNQKYAYLENDQKFLVIIANNLQSEQEERKVIGWTLANLPRINPSICMHRILLEEEARLVRQPQRQLNPTILDVAKEEVMKLLVVGIIYPISYSQWVSPMQVVPKKFRITVVKNQNDELVPTGI
ncbi:hypothetical protein CR513_22861, partial [Mucuna pruriens]